MTYSEYEEYQDDIYSDYSNGDITQEVLESLLERLQEDWEENGEGD